jgi:hypothetical protein
MLQGLSPQTSQIFEQVSRLKCIAGYTLIGGTALALQLRHRLSEDLDFCKWKQTINERVVVDWSVIEAELSTIGDVKKDLLGDNQCDFAVRGVKLSFYGNNRLKAPVNLCKIPLLNNLVIADVESTGIMKMEVMSRRRTLRDYYDMSVILEQGVSLEHIIEGAGSYTNHGLKARNMLAILNNTEHIPDDAGLAHLNPAYSTDIKRIREVISGKIREYVDKRKHN